MSSSRRVAPFALALACNSTLSVEDGTTTAATDASPTDTTDPADATSTAASTTTTADPSTDATATTSAPTTGPPDLILCGDGVVGGDETCDDANPDPDDGCDACVSTIAIAWDRMIDGPGHLHDFTNAVAVAPDGSVYLGGMEGALDATLDVVVHKLDAGGAPLWSRTFTGPGGENDPAFDLAVDPDGGVIIVGAASVDIGRTSPWARRYAADGEVVWTFTEDGPWGGFNALNAVAIDGDAVFIVGNDALAATSSQATVRRLDLASGAEQWQRDVASSVAGDCLMLAVVVVGGELLVAGQIPVGVDQKHAMFERWTTDGEMVSHWTYGDPQSTDVAFYNLLPRVDGDVIVHASDWDGQINHAHLLRFTATDELVWDHAILGAAANTGLGGLIEDPQGRLLISGVHLVGSKLHGFVALHGLDGAPLRIVYMNPGSDPSESDVRAIAIADDGFVAGGMGVSPNYRWDLWIRKFALL